MPFYQFNSFTGRLKPSTKLHSLYPISPRPLQKAEPVIFDTMKTKPVIVANYCTSKPPTLQPKMWEEYKFFQSVIEKPIFLARGRKDKILFGFIATYVGVCTLQSFYFIAKECLNII